MEIQWSQATIENANRGKKRPLQPDQWKRNMQKSSRVAGRQYVSTHNGATVPDKNPPTGVRRLK